MKEPLQPPILIVGIGDESSHDNAVGLVAVRKIAATFEPSSEVGLVEMNGEGHTLMDAWHGAKTVILIDAVSLGDEPGTLYYFDAHKQQLPVESFYSPSCAFNFTDAIQLAKSLKELPPTLIIYGVEREITTLGTGLTPQVEQTVEVLSALLRDWIQCYSPFVAV